MVIHNKIIQPTNINIPIMRNLQFCGLVIFLAACSNTEQCDLNRLNIKGDVVKLEVSTQTTIPISEWLYTDISTENLQRSIRKDAVYSFCGQSQITFDKHGNFSKLAAFDNSGKQLYGNPKLTRAITLYNPININVNELADGWRLEYDSIGRIIEQKNEHNGKLYFDRFITYNKKGDIDMVICKYNHLKLQRVYIPEDTTFFKYTKYDKEDNWTEATIQKRGLIKTDSYVMTVRRQFSYANQTERKNLINDLQSWNEEIKKQNPATFNLISASFFDGAIQMDMPRDMEIEKAFSMNNNLNVDKLNTDKGFFSISVSIEQQAESVYDITDEEADKATTYLLAQNSIAILKWQGFYVMNINGKRFGEINYCHYATGGATSTGDPVITKVLFYQENDTNSCFNISIGYDSYHENLYKPLMEK